MNYIIDTFGKDWKAAQKSWNEGVLKERISKVKLSNLLQSQLFVKFCQFFVDVLIIKNYLPSSSYK